MVNPIHPIIKSLAVVALVSTSFISCSHSTKNVGFKDNESAVEAYHDYLTEVRNVKTTDSKGFAGELVKWHSLTDTVLRYIQKDSTLYTNVPLGERFLSIRDSIRIEMLRLAETWKVSYQDVINIKQAASPYVGDADLEAAVTAASPFFASLDSVDVLKGSRASILAGYRKLLKTAVEEGFESTSELKSFLKTEDVYFRSYLEHLPEMQQESVADITENTKKACSLVFTASKEGKIPPKEALVYMSMRTARRLIQNSIVCVNGIEDKTMKDPSQINAYLWMIVQPFISIDDFGIATMSAEERLQLMDIAGYLPGSIKFARSFNVDQRMLNYLLPQQLLKIYIDSL